jgi:predicted porin
MYSASVQWAGMGGRLRVGLALDGHKEFTSQGKTDTGVAIKGGWNFGFMDVGLAYEAMTYKSQNSDCEAKQYGVAVAIPVGNGAIRGSYAIAKDIKGDYTGAATAAGTFGPGSCGAVATAAFDPSDNGAKTYNIGYDYRFSKRTTVGFGYAAIKNDQAAVFTWSGAPSTQGSATVTPFAGSDPSTFFVNMIHRF